MTQISNIHYNYIYLICLYGNTTEKQVDFRVRNHLSFLQRYKYIENKKILFVVSQKGENEKTSQIIQDNFDSNKEERVHTLLLQGPNFGMLVGSLWDIWKYCEKNNISSDYILGMEDDWIYNRWKEKERLLDEGYIYIGMFSVMDRNTPKYEEWFRLGYKVVPRDYNDPIETHIMNRIGASNVPERRWTDGGLYFLKFSSLKEIENRIGKFTKAEEPFNYYEHGISYGETGFPTSLYAKGFRFRAHEYMILQENKRWTSISSVQLARVSDKFCRDENCSLQESFG